MKTLFGIRSNVAVITIGSLYLIISLHTTVYGIKNFQAFLSEDYTPSGYLLINTETNFFHIASVILSVSCLLSSILLILGIVEKRYNVLQPWLVFNFVLECILINFLFYIIYLLIQTYKSSWLNVCGLLLAVYINFLALAFHDYIRIDIYCTYQKLQKEARRLYRVIDNEDNEGVDVL